MQLMNKRVYYLDNLSGLLICYMMLNHVLLMGQVDCSVDNILLEPLQFFMFWFFFKSGMFYTPKNYKQLFIRGGQKILVPLAIYSFLGHIVQCLKLFASDDYNWKHYLLTPIKEFVCTGSVTGNHPLWFLFSLFFVQLLFNELYVRKIKPQFIFIINIIIPIVLYYNSISNLPIYLTNVPLGLSVYTLGYIFKNRQFDKKLISIAGIIYLGVILFYPSHLIFRSNTLNSGGNYLLAIIFSLAGCVVFNNIFKFLPNCRVLQFIGQHSMTYYVTHWVILNVCTLIMVTGFHRQGVTVFVMMILACLLIPTLIIKIKK